MRAPRQAARIAGGLAARVEQAREAGVEVLAAQRVQPARSRAALRMTPASRSTLK